MHHPPQTTDQSFTTPPNKPLMRDLVDDGRSNLTGEWFAPIGARIFFSNGEGERCRCVAINEMARKSQKNTSRATKDKGKCCVFGRAFNLRCVDGARGRHE